MRIWVIGRGYPTENNKMLGSFELEQAKMLARGGAEVFYPLVDMRSFRRWRKMGVQCRTEESVIIATLNLPIGKLLSAKKRRELFPKAMNMLTGNLIKKHGLPDVIHVHYPSLFSFSIVDHLQKQGVRIICTEHYTKVLDKSLTEENYENLKNFVERSNAFCCVGELLRKSVVELTDTNRSITLMPNVVNKNFKPGKDQHEGFRFITSGRLVPVKRFDKVVEAFLNVFAGNKSVTLDMAGSGEEFDAIQGIIEERGAKDQVRLLGTLSREKMVDFIGSCDALISFSELETFCVPLIEAWACGKPVIATNVSVLAEDQDSRLGILVDWKDIRTLENALSSIYEHYSEYDSEWISKYAQDHFSESVIREKLLGIYNNC